MRRGATRVLLAVSLLVAPAPFFMLFLVGLVPFPWIAVFLGGSFLHGDPTMMALAAIHLLADVAVLYLACASVSGLLFAVLPPQRASTAAALVAVALVIASFFPIYVLIGEHDVRRATLLGVFVPESS